MQGVVCLPQNLQQGSPPPNSTIVTDMEMESKDAILNQSDSGIFSTTTNTTMDQTDVSANDNTDNRSDCSSPERKYVCPICEKMLTSQHDFTLHIRSHNNEAAELQDNEKGFVCRICNKVLSSSSSLDRHVLVHSGERPFHCKYCGDTFTTNGNMHRHMRTHKSDNNYESDGSVESNASTNSKTEYNNNKIETKFNAKRKHDDPSEMVASKRRDVHDENGENRQTFKCPVCERADFDTMNNLETHLEDNHPEYPSKCGQCKQIFLNNKLLCIHKATQHDSCVTKHPVVGFKDLTFVDFSSEKFPHIARRECEMNLHKVAGGLKFQCKKCSRAFPCSNSLEIHEKNCVLTVEMGGGGLDLSKTNESEIRRLEFFSRLNLQDNSPEKKGFLHQENPTKLREHLAKAICMDSTKDLADIQSILTNINLQQQKHGGLGGGGKNFDGESMKGEQQEEESQDLFAVEFRKMKLRGEFPCRLCTAVFPNLRALKGHNRAHLSGNNNGTYHCNMCPHSSIDKAALIRHMRTHNGDRPYECSLCNYAFTTKANCERHLRNRHAKSTREEVKKAIIYHPSEDPTNEDLNKLTSRETDVKKLNSSLSTDASDVSPEKLHCSTPKLERADIKSELIMKQSLPPLIPDLQKLKPQFFTDILRNNKLHEHNSIIPNGIPSPLPYNFSQKLPSSPSKIQVKSLETLKNYEQSDDEYVEDEEQPMVLDLSKKKKEERKRLDSEDGPQDLTKKSPPPLAQQFMGEIFAQQLLKTPPKIDPAALYASQLARFYQNSFQNWGGFPLNPLLFPAMAPMAANPQDLKERMQRLQLCGGSFIAEDLKHIQNLQQQSMRYNGLKMENKMDERKPEDLKPLTVDTGFHDSINKLQSPSSKDLMQSPNSVKMVIKNGVLMPKQKQRRYRTERPFTCEHCSARFTLRSNMERHIKQQHPQFWSQRQRGSVGNPGRKSHSMKAGYCDLSIPNYEVPKTSEYEDSKEHLNEKLKFAILAQQLRAAVNQPEIKKEEVDEECALVIDENNEKKTDDKHQRPYEGSKILEEKLNEYQAQTREKKNDENQDLVPVSRLLDNASQQQFKEYFKRDGEEQEVGGVSEEDEEGLVASGSTSEGNISGTDENKSESETVIPVKKKSAYSLAPNRVSCPYCSRKFPWTSSLRRHILTHTGQKPFKCSHCPLLFTTKSNCDRHLLRKHGNSAMTITNDQQNNNSNFLIRNVPERPFKCSNCPSSTFSTYSNLKKHISCKHSTNAQGDDIKAQGYEAGSSEDEKVTSGAEKNDWEPPVYSTKLPDNSQVQNSDLPFKCHLCDGSFGERQDALEHIRDKHASEYDLLMSKNALDSNATTPDDSAHHDDEESEIRGKFPDYSNRKVICAFCMRRFWSAEDLRRHMRTHTGERPFSCDICRRRFTLKHSMLRHRKKHNFDNDNVSDEDGNVPPTFEKFIKAENNNLQKQEKTDESDGNEGGDLISNLLGIRDRSIIDKVLAASADDAAKLLGVKNGVKE